MLVNARRKRSAPRPPRLLHIFEISPAEFLFLSEKELAGVRLS